MKPNLGDVIAEKYRLDRVLGEGGMSMVFAAANVLTGKPVAIKWLQPEVLGDEEQSQRLLREAQATSNIDHPNVVNVFDVGRHEGALFLVMELLHGEPLSELLMRGPQDPVEFVRLMMPVLRGVHAAHRNGVVHRDLKPDNIFMCRGLEGDAREPKVLDFGISKLTGDLLEPGKELTREGTVFGTPQYMAPEQMRDARIADARSDVYALGVIFYRAFSNEYPYDADTLTALAIRIVEGNAPPLHELCPKLDRGLSELVMRALSLDPEQRFQTVAELGTALEGYSDGVLFTQSSFERESATWLRRDSTAVLLADGTSSLQRSDSAPLPRRTDSTPSLRAISPPPPPPRSTPSLSLARIDTSSRQSTTALDATDLLVAAEELPSGSVERPSTPTHSTRLSIPRPPPPTNTRPNPVLEVIVDDSYSTQRVDRWSSRRQTLAIGLALFAIGSIAPAGWQLWEKARGAQHGVEARPRALVAGKGANVLAAIQQRSAAQAVQPPAEAPLAAKEAPAPAAPSEVAAAPSEVAAAPSGVAAAPSQVAAEPSEVAAEPGAAAPSAPVLPRGISTPSRRSRSSSRRRARNSTREVLSPAALASENYGSTPDVATGTASIEALPNTASERNPYLRR
jgi:serine/threonine protein kinase